MLYKKNYEIPKPLERRLFRLAGLIELADEEFKGIRESHENFYKHLTQLDNENNFGMQAIDKVSLTYLFKESGKRQIFIVIKDYAEDAGFEERKSSMKNDSFLSEINLFSKKLALKNIRELLAVLEKNKPFYETYFRFLIENTANKRWYGDIEFYVGLALMYEL